jgi:trimethylamine--corrinoid protein Co-methyltransferase
MSLGAHMTPSNPSGAHTSPEPGQRVLPRLSLLTQEQIEQIHTYALRVLETTGVRVDSQRALQLFEKKLGSQALQDGRVRIPREVVEWAIQSAPSTIDVYNRRGDFAFRLGDDRTRFGIGVTTLFYQDPVTDELTPFAREHMAQMSRLGDALPNFDVISTVGIVQDVPPERSDLYGSLEMMANTTKPLVVLVSDEKRFPDVLDLFERLHGDLGERPFILPYFNPVTPLIINEGTGDKMLEAIERGLPIIFSNYSLAGTSTPITPAGMLALMMAELLAGLTLSQIFKPGAPIILGILPAFFDMKTMVNFYDPQSMLLNLACAELMAHYRLPHCGTSGSGTGWGPDLLASETYWMNHLTSVINKVGLAPFVGDTLASKAFSPTNVVYVHEIIEQALRFAGGFELSEQAAALGDIDQVGPGGNFLTAKSTIRHFRTAYYTRPIFPRYSMEKWKANGRPPAIDLLREHTRQLLAGLQAPEDHDELMARGEAFIKRIR